MITHFSKYFFEKSLFSKVLSPGFTAYRLLVMSSVSQGNNVQLTCSPLSAKVDEKVSIAIQGLEANQKISLFTKLVGDVQDKYHSLAHYIADQQGQVRLNSQPSVGGSYVGVEPMGFIWSLKPEPGQKPGRRLLKRDVTKPYLVDLEVLDGHLDIQNTANYHPTLCRLTIERHYMAAGVRRMEIRDGRLRGTLFLPPGDGPFQGVMCLFNSYGVLQEDRSALLASSGFAAFSLQYWGGEDLPKKLEDIEFEYFLEAVEWFKNHPLISPGGVGLMGLSSGGMKGLFLASHCKDIKPFVWIASRHELTDTMKYNGKNVDFCPADHSRTKVNEDGSISFRDCYETNSWQGDILDDPRAIPVENVQGPILLVYGNDDQCYNAELSATKIYERMKAFGKEAQCTILGYHGAGHIFQPPYNPPVLMSFQKTSGGIYLNWGGDVKASSDAHEDSWPKIKTFLRNNLPMDKPKL